MGVTVKDADSFFAAEDFDRGISHSMRLLCAIKEKNRMTFHEARSWGYLPCLLDVPRNSQQSAFAGLLSCSPCYCTKVSNIVLILCAIKDLPQYLQRF